MHSLFAKAYSNSTAVLYRNSHENRNIHYIFCYTALAVFIETAMKIKCTVFLLKHIAIALLSFIETVMKIRIYTTSFAI
jgi:hypothetical protein